MVRYHPFQWQHQSPAYSSPFAGHCPWGYFLYPIASFVVQVGVDTILQVSVAGMDCSGLSPMGYPVLHSIDSFDLPIDRDEKNHCHHCYWRYAMLHSFCKNLMEHPRTSFHHCCFHSILLHHLHWQRDYSVFGFQDDH